MNICTHSKNIVEYSKDIEYTNYEEMLYQLYIKLYINSNLSFNDKKIFVKTYPPEYDERTGFRHLITEDINHTGKESDRKPNIYRCERLTWADEIIKNCATMFCKKIKIWENIRKTKKNILIYCDDIRYLVVLGIRENYYVLITAYPVVYPSARRDLLNEYSKYISKQRSQI